MIWIKFLWALVNLEYRRAYYYEKNFILNLRSKEVHRAESKDGRCFLRIMKNKRYITEYEFDKLLKDGLANGCRHCLRKFDTD